MKKKHLEVRKRLYSDFDFYSKSALKIRTKQGEIAPLALNSAQQILHEAVQKQMRDDGKIRVIILKARQQGLSTYSGGYLYFFSQPTESTEGDGDLVKSFLKLASISTSRDNKTLYCHVLTLNIP